MSHIKGKAKKENQSTQTYGPSTEPVNAVLASILQEMGDYEKNFNQKIYKYYAYRKAAHSMMDYPEKITSGEEAMKYVPGVGKDICKVINEYLKTGKIKLLDEERKNPDYKFIKDLVRVDGIGPVHAQKFLKMGIKSLDELKAHTDKLNHHERIGLKYVEDFEKRIPRNEMCLIKELLLSEIKSLDEKFSVTLCGSFRRGASSSNHVDVLLTHPSYVSNMYKNNIKSEPDLESGLKMEIKHEISPKFEPIKTDNNDNEIDTHSMTDTESKNKARSLLEKVIKQLIDCVFITDTFAFGDTKYNGVCRLKENFPNRRINIRLIPEDEYILGLFYFTGSFDFSKHIRKIASNKGFILNEYCLRRIHSSGRPGKPLKITCEKDIFDYLDLEYKAPSERNM